MKNYFELFFLPINFAVNLDDLEQKYFASQKLLHPDKSSLNDIENSIIINKAYEVLKNPLKRAFYILQLNGIDLENDETAIRPDLATLEEVLEIQEKIPSLSEDEILELKKYLNLQISFAIEKASQELESKESIAAAQFLAKAKYFDKILKDLKK